MGILPDWQIKRDVKIEHRAKLACDPFELPRLGFAIDPTVADGICMARALHIAACAPATGVDTPEDLERVRQFYKS